MPAKASGVLTLDTAPFIKSLESAKIALKGFAVAVGAIALTAVAGFAVLGFGVLKVINIFKDGIASAFAFGKEMSEAARQFRGIGVGDNFLILKALERSGMGPQEAAEAMKTMIESGRPLSAIWATAQDAANAIKAATEDFGPMADALDKGAKGMLIISDLLEAIKLKVATFFMSFIASIVEPLKLILSLIKDAFDFSKIGTKLGDELGAVLDQWIGGFTNGNIGEVLGAQLKLAWLDLTEGINDTYARLNTMADFGGKLEEILSASGSLVAELLMDAFIQGARIIGDVLAMSWKLLARVLHESNPSFFGGTSEMTAAKKEANSYNNQIAELTAKLQTQTRVTGQDVEASGGESGDEVGAPYATSVQRLVDNDKLAALLKKQRLAIGTYEMESGKGDALAPDLKAKVEAQNAIKNAAKVKGRADEDTAQKDRIAAKADRLKVAAESMGGAVGQAASQFAATAEAFGKTRKELDKIISDAQVAGIIKEEEYKAAHPESMGTAPPVFTGMPMEVIAGSLAKMGGGGNVFQLGGDSVQAKIEKNTKAAAGTMQEIRADTRKMAEKSNDGLTLGR